MTVTVWAVVDKHGLVRWLLLTRELARERARQPEARRLQYRVVKCVGVRS